MGLITGPVFVGDADVTSLDMAVQPSPTALFPALRTLRFGVFQSPLGNLLSILPQNTPCLESLDSWEAVCGDGLIFPFEGVLADAQILRMSRWGCLKSLSLPNCSIGMFASAVKMSPVPVLLPELLGVEICFIQDEGAMKPALESFPIFFPKLQSLGLFHDGTGLYGTFNYNIQNELSVEKNFTAQYDFLVEGFGVFNLISKFSQRHPTIRVEFKPAPDSDFLRY